jgi:hypothetical protein
MASKNQADTAARILNGENYPDIFRGRKITDFGHLIEHGQDTDPNNPRVVIDRHALGVAHGGYADDGVYEHSKLSRSGPVYRDVANMYKQAADMINANGGHNGVPIQPHQLQAATWLTRQRLNGEGGYADETTANRTRKIAEASVNNWNAYAAANHPDLVGKTPGTGFSARQPLLAPLPDPVQEPVAGPMAVQAAYDWSQHPPHLRPAQHRLEWKPGTPGKGFILTNGSVWTWPTENMRPQHMQYAQKVKREGLQVKPQTAFHIEPEGRVWQYNAPGTMEFEKRKLGPEDKYTIQYHAPQSGLWFGEQGDAPPAPVQADQFGHATSLLDRLNTQPAENAGVGGTETPVTSSRVCGSDDWDDDDDDWPVHWNHPGDRLTQGRSLKGPRAGYEPLDNGGDYYGGGGCYYLALAMHNQYGLPIGTSYGRDGYLHHAWVHDGTHAYDAYGIHEHPESPGWSWNDKINLDTDPRSLVESINTDGGSERIRYDPDEPWGDINVLAAAPFSERHFQPIEPSPTISSQVCGVCRGRPYTACPGCVK